VEVTVAGTKYHISPKEITWQQAQDACKALGGTLASATSAQLAEQITDKVSSELPTIYHYWLGGLIKDSSWSWVDGSQWSYTRWLPGEPNGFLQNEHCVSAVARPASDPYNSGWNDNSCDSKLGFVCRLGGERPLLHPACCPTGCIVNGAKARPALSAGAQAVA
jgi:hypothetical protein